MKYFIHYSFIIFSLTCDVEEVFGEYYNGTFVQEVYYILESDATCIVYFIIWFW